MIEEIQNILKSLNIDGWLIYDFQNKNYIARSILNITEHTTRVLFYFIPKQGKPIKLLSKVEPDKLSNFAGEIIFYRTWKEMREKLKEILSPYNIVAMEYSKKFSIPHLSILDAGIYEIIKGFKINIVSSSKIVQNLSIIKEEEMETHYRAGEIIKQALFEVLENFKNFKYEHEVQEFIYEYLTKNNLTMDGDMPIFATGENTSNPHYFPKKENPTKIEYRKPFLIDIWARLNIKNSIYYDITYIGYYGKASDEYKKVFDIVKTARDMAVDFITERLEKGKDVFGYEVDDLVRRYIGKKGYGENFVHRTGHSIGRSVHWINVNLDNFETHDDRNIINGCLFSVEPGIYIQNNFGIRSEINVYIQKNRANITTIKQEQIVEL
ncbi:MAG: M24 family metallopeptidase [candidate division WOR-3 bacterium]|nr:M24 family metallopeptidase [candidate division WOR-3 bacterium]MCX7947590.1 M24 family metallopeptidase [candidate division WOR-3 bacterium]MDW8150475.1 M24 family metallopeptidase [candidate division WOR-3 bacterium]